jgi:hypothetical protein
MGRVKAWAESEFEKSLALREEQAGFGAQSDGDEPSSNWELEFNEWLDAYEKSFGVGGKFYD